MDSTTSTRSRSGRRNGITLIETLIALFLLGLFVAVSVQVLTSSRRTRDMARTNFQAVTLARDRLERVHAFDFTQIDMAGETWVRINESGHVDPTGRFRRSTQVNTVTNSPHLRHVVVTVETLSPFTQRFDGQAQRLETLMANFEIEP